MHKYAKICNGKYVSNMQVFAEICNAKYAIICKHIIHAYSLICKYMQNHMQKYALYADICSPKI